MFPNYRALSTATFLIGIIILLLLGVSFARAETVYFPDQASFSWEPSDVSVAPDGSTTPIPETDEVVYEIYRTPYPFNIDPEDPAAAELVGETPDPNYTATFTTEGRWYYATRAKRIAKDTAGNVIATEFSGLAWTNDPEVMDEGQDTWSWLNILPPITPGRLKKILTP